MIMSSESSDTDTSSGHESEEDVWGVTTWGGGRMQPIQVSFNRNINMTLTTILIEIQMTFELPV